MRRLHDAIERRVDEALKIDGQACALEQVELVVEVERLEQLRFGLGVEREGERHHDVSARAASTLGACDAHPHRKRA